jgi:hypothetical protein
VNTDDKDDIFSLIEVHRGKFETPEVLDNVPMPPDEGKATKPGKEKKGKRKKADEETD